MRNFLINTFTKNGFNLTELQIDQFIKYLEYLKTENEKFNITAIKDDKEIIIKHFLDSVMVSRFFDFNSVSSIIDIGTGGGFPGMPIKIMYPHLNVTLVDALNKRINFLTELTNILGLNNVNPIHARSEELAHDEIYREKYDVCLSRAVAYLNTLSEYCIPFVKKDGYFIPLKKEEVEEELNISKDAIKLLGCKTEKVEEYKIEEEDILIEHSLIFIKKNDNTNIKYPRSNKLIKNKPL